MPEQSRERDSKAAYELLSALRAAGNPGTAMWDPPSKRDLKRAGIGVPRGHIFPAPFQYWEIGTRFEESGSDYHHGRTVALGLRPDGSVVDLLTGGSVQYWLQYQVVEAIGNRFGVRINNAKPDWVVPWDKLQELREGIGRLSINVL